MARMSRAVVVGATGELGRVIVEHLLREGHEVVAVARRSEPLAELAARMSGVSTCSADASDDSCVPAIRAALGDRPIALAVHCAAAPLGGAILSVEPGVILAAVDVKVGGLLRLVRAVQPGLREGSRVVAVGGSLGYDPSPDGSTAGVANAALANAVRQLNRALAPRGVTCHVVAPGPVETARFLRLAGDESRRRGVDVEVVLEEARRQTPLGRLTTPEEVAWAVARIADPEAAALAGGTLLLDGGRRTAIP